MTVQSVSRSHVGLVRLINEDRLFDCPERGLWAVADGMGGHSGGDIAAQCVVDALRDYAMTSATIDEAGMLRSIARANTAIVNRNLAQSTNAGSTVVAAHLIGRRATIAWVGDSRAYLIRASTLTQLTHDHSFVQDLIDAGLIDVAAAAHHPSANVVTRALGVNADVDIATTSLVLAPGDRLLLCSDGLSRSLKGVGRELQLDALADELLHHALDRDGSDNVALVCFEVA